MSKKVYRERECIHKNEGAEGELYNGVLYIKAIQSLPSIEAVKISRRVEQFYWSDASDIMVWLCTDCAKALHLNESPRAVVSVTQQQRRVNPY